MKTAFSVLPDWFEDGRHLALEAGLQAAGYRLHRGYGTPSGTDDVLIAWIVHHGSKEQQARQEAASFGWQSPTWLLSFGPRGGRPDTCLRYSFLPGRLG